MMNNGTVWAMNGAVVMSLFIGCPSILVYIAEIALLLVHRRRFDASFYSLFIARSIPSIVNFFSGFIQVKLGVLNIGYDVFRRFPTAVLALMFITYYYTSQVENVATLFILLNRCTSVLLPMGHKRLWRKWLPLSLILIFILPMIVVSPNFSRRFMLKKMELISIYVIDYDKTNDKFWRNSKLAGVMGSVFCLLSIVLNVITLAIYRLQAAPTPSSKNAQPLQRKRALELRLTIYGFTTFIAQLLLVLYSIFVYLQGSALSMTLYANISWIGDLCTVAIPSWLLLWASSEVRQELFRWLNIYRPSNDRTTITVQLSTNSTTFSLPKKQRRMSSNAYWIPAHRR